MALLGPASLLILASNIGLSLYGLYVSPALIERCLFRPYEFARGRNRASLFTSGFVHADLAHLAFNMFTFFFFGPMLERRIGTPAFVALYLAGLAASSIGTYRKHRNDAGYATLGASGAISAVLFAAIIYFPSTSLFIFPIPIPIPAPLFAVGYLWYSWWSGRSNRGRINHDAHFGGALAGIAFVALFDPDSFGRAIRMVLQSG